MQYGEFTYDCENGMFCARHKLSNGQYCMIALMEYERSRGAEYYVVFAVANKKKNLTGYFDENKNNNLTLKMTGTCGVEALFWAKKMLLQFERDVLPRRMGENEQVKIVVIGEDARRFQFYEKVLPRLGYYKSCVDGSMAMIKTFEAGDEVEDDISGSRGDDADASERV